MHRLLRPPSHETLGDDAEEVINLERAVLREVGAVDRVLHLGGAVERAQRVGVEV